MKPRPKELVWQGTALGEVDDDIHSREKNISKAVGEVYMRYPVNK